MNRLGFVYAPVRDELFAGGPGRGATLNGKPIRVRKASSVNEGLTAFGYSLRLPPKAYTEAFDRILAEGGVFYRDGSGALALAYLAAGRLIAYIEPHINSYDCLGAMAVIEGAGGKINDFLEGDALFKGNWIIASSPELYPVLVDLTRYG